MKLIARYFAGEASKVMNVVHEGAIEVCEGIVWAIRVGVVTAFGLAFSSIPFVIVAKVAPIATGPLAIVAILLSISVAVSYASKPMHTNQRGPELKKGWWWS